MNGRAQALLMGWRDAPRIPAPALSFRAGRRSIALALMWSSAWDFELTGSSWTRAT